MGSRGNRSNGLRHNNNHAPTPTLPTQAPSQIPKPPLTPARLATVLTLNRAIAGRAHDQRRSADSGPCPVQAPIHIQSRPNDLADCTTAPNSDSAARTASQARCTRTIANHSSPCGPGGIEDVLATSTTTKFRPGTLRRQARQRSHGLPSDGRISGPSGPDDGP